MEAAIIHFYFDFASYTLMSLRLFHIFRFTSPDAVKKKKSEKFEKSFIWGRFSTGADDNLSFFMALPDAHHILVLVRIDGHSFTKHRKMKITYTSNLSKVFNLIYSFIIIL